MSVIPKVIHYCWFGPKPIPEIFKICYESWKKFCPDYELLFWNEDNFNINANEYLSKTYAMGRFAFFNDLARLMIVNQNGGIYLDIDVELISSLDKFDALLGFIGFESKNYVNTGNGFGSIKNTRLVSNMIDLYIKDSHLINEEYQFQTAPFKESAYLESKYGLKRDNSYQILDEFHILPSDYLCPIEYSSKNNNFTENTVSIHHYANTWFNKNQRLNRSIDVFFDTYFGNIFGIKISRKISKIFNYSVNFFFRIKNHGIKNTLIFMKKKLLRRNNNG